MTIPGVRAFTSLSRRIRTLIVSGTAFAGLLILGFTLPVPYVVLSPGPTCNTIGSGADCQTDTIIVINGTKANDVSGHLNLTTVDVTVQSQTVFDVLSAWLSSDEVVVPKSSVNPPGESQDQVNQQNANDFTESQDNAIAASSCELGYPKKSGISGVESSGASFDKLRPADIVTSLDGTPASTGEQVAAALAKFAPGTTVQVGIIREGKAQTVAVTLGPAIKKGSNVGSLGVLFGTICQFPFSVKLGLGSQIGGPSAGLMFSLGIMDKVGKVDLAHGLFIAGTGTIDPDGTVGPIGGIALKMLGARRAGATVFLAPAGNCADVKGTTPKGLDVIKVSSLHDAVTSLEALQAGKPVPHC